MRLEDFIGNSNEINTVADVPHLRWYVTEDEVLKIKGIKEPIFQGLNNSLALKIRADVSKRVLDETGEFLLNPDGSIKREYVSVPVGSACILSQIPLNIPFRYSYEKGFTFVDASFNPAKPGFIYMLPKVFLFRQPMVGLALSRKKMDSYRSIKVTLSGYKNVYLHVIPYKPRKVYRATILLKTYCDPFYTFEREIVQQLSMWQDLGILLNVEESDYNLLEIDSEEICLGGTDFENT